MELAKDKFFRNIGWLMGGKIANMILQFVVSLATARYLGPSNFGTITYVEAYVSFFSSIASLGLSVVAIKEIAQGRLDDNQIIWTSIYMRLLTAIFSSISVVLMLFITSDGDQQIVAIAVLSSVSIVFSAFDTINYWFQAKLLSKYSSIAGVIAYIAMSIYRIYLLATSANVILFAFATSINMIFLAGVLIIFYVRENGFKPCFNWEVGLKLVKQSYHYLIAGMIMIVYSQVDKIMIAKMINTEAVGLYSAALGISALWGVIPMALIQSLSPVLYKAKENNQELFLRRMRQSYAVIIWLNVAYSIFVSIFATPIILLLYGDAYYGAKNAVIIVVWYYGISTMSTLNQVYLASNNQNKYINKFCLGGLIVDIVLNTIMIPHWGITGAAFSTLITHITIQIIMPFLYKDTREITIQIVRGALLRDVVNEEEKTFIYNIRKPVLKRK